MEQNKKTCTTCRLIHLDPEVQPCIASLVFLFLTLMNFILGLLASKIHDARKVWLFPPCHSHSHTSVNFVLAAKSIYLPTDFHVYLNAQEEMEQLEKMERASTSCQEFLDSVDNKPDPLLPDL
ncbi:PREDICTED: uncharacterized protein LOC104822806 isoform X3 [Tarenaya hassleriana]|uniref:uncharacterized protein LOC104822806 isoform X3 n=1 Tax=Tarenaya hassleriana TaxID=28532 RepID=UPI0008FD4E1A|nr:PREDICTED: uncharacterized protein LOC104822806 isoform X3 [Tarenaya hassleriana]